MTAMKALCAVVLLCLPASLGRAAGDAVTAVVARVAAERVNLRARPDMKSEVVATVQRGDRLAVLSEQLAWVEVAPPDSVEAWIHRDFMQQGAVVGDQVNLRSGPGINYAVVGKAPAGAVLGERARFGDWIRVAPLGARAWVNRNFVELLRPPPPLPPPDLPPAEPQPPTPPAAPGVAAPLPPPPALVQPSDVAGGMKLVPLDGQGRQVRVTGELSVSPLLLRHIARYRLVERHGTRLTPLCYVRGNNEQLRSLLDQRLTLEGREYWVAGSRQPVVVPERIERLPTP